MRVFEVFQLIDQHEENDERNDKMNLFRHIIELCEYIDTDDFGSIIQNHEKIVEQFNANKFYMNMNDGKNNDYIISDYMTDVYNYPEIMAEYKDILEEYEYYVVTEDEKNVIDGDVECEQGTDEDYNDDDFEAEDDSDGESIENDKVTNECHMDLISITREVSAINTKLNFIILVSVATFGLAVMCNTIACVSVFQK